ncbi:hypothetical protein [Mycobacterium sp. MMS18-G62]
MSGKTKAMVVRAWRDHDKLLVRVLETSSSTVATREFVCTSIDEACAVVSALLREVCVTPDRHHASLTPAHTLLDTAPETIGDTSIPDSGFERDHMEER